MTPRARATMLMLVLVTWGHATVAQAQVDIANSQPVSVGDLRKIYSGKTWKWNEGAGYLLSNGKFRAYGGAARDAHYA